jgi:hypothetical protein
MVKVSASESDSKLCVLNRGTELIMRLRLGGMGMVSLFRFSVFKNWYFSYDFFIFLTFCGE